MALDVLACRQDRVVLPVLVDEAEAMEALVVHQSHGSFGCGEPGLDAAGIGEGLEQGNHAGLWRLLVLLGSRGDIGGIGGIRSLNLNIGSAQKKVIDALGTPDLPDHLGALARRALVLVLPTDIQTLDTKLRRALGTEGYSRAPRHGRDVLVHQHAWPSAPLQHFHGKRRYLATVLAARDPPRGAVPVPGLEYAVDAAKLVLQHTQVLFGTDGNLTEGVACHAQHAVAAGGPVLALLVRELVEFVDFVADGGYTLDYGVLLLLYGVLYAVYQSGGVDLDLLIAGGDGAGILAAVVVCGSSGEGLVGVEVRVEIVKAVAVVLGALQGVD